MNRKQVIIVSLLIVAVVLSTAAIVMNSAVFSSFDFSIQEKTFSPNEPNLKLVIQETPQNTFGGDSNGV